MAAKPRNRDRKAQERRRQIGEKFAKRHPARAREERTFKQRQKQIDREAEQQARGALPRDHGTPETQAHVRGLHQGALARLYERGHISIEQLAASQQIRSVHERIGRDVSIGIASLEGRVDNSRAHGGAFFESLGAVRAEVAYGRWREELGASLAPVLALVVDDCACRRVARTYRMRDAGLRKLLSDALDAWNEQLGQACGEIDEATLLAAHAGIL